MQCWRLGFQSATVQHYFSLFSLSDVWSLSCLNSKDFLLFVLLQAIIHAPISSLWRVSQTYFYWSWLCSSWLANFTLYYPGSMRFFRWQRRPKCLRSIQMWIRVTKVTRMLDDSMKSVRHERQSGRFSKSRGLAASVSFLPLPHLFIFALTPFFMRAKLWKPRSSLFAPWKCLQRRLSLA